MATAFFLSVFFTKTRTATVVGYTYVLAIGLFGPNVIGVYFANPETPPETVFGLCVFPPFAFYRGTPLFTSNSTHTHTLLMQFPNSQRLGYSDQCHHLWWHWHSTTRIELP